MTDAGKYKDAGVDVSLGDALSQAAATASVATFGSLVRQIGPVPYIDIAKLNLRHPQLMLATDGVGTKLKIAFSAQHHDTVGIDAVAMCVNDVLRWGAKPIAVSCYFATSHLDSSVHLAVIRGVVAGCQLAGAPLVGGETAELPSFYAPGEYELAATGLGVVEDGGAISGARLGPGDMLLGLASSGLHSNGYSLVRRVLQDIDLEGQFPDAGIERSLAAELLEPTRIYSAQVSALLSGCDGDDIHGIAHITGGGIKRKLQRIIPDGLGARLIAGSWPVHPIFRLIERIGNIEEEEMFSTFNMGLGMIVICERTTAQSCLSTLESVGETPFMIGEIVRASADSQRVVVE